ncbi:MAG TPA: tetratricopeptide repeat protein [Bacteroidales bacterium]|jgi:tetratricopeptide (TPR) repeat protein|nr:tetratricopeptide repeat protein [Bacteroidales bacterium]
MKKNYVLIALFLIALIPAAWSQVDKGLELLLLEDFDEAKKVFEQTATSQPDIAYYYLGEIALQKENTEEAMAHYQKGISADEDAIFCQIGATKLSLKSNPDEFKKSMKGFAKKNRKKAPVLLAVAQAYRYNDMHKDASGALSSARSADKTYPYIYLFEGYWMEKQGNTGGAATQYEQAINFDPNCAVAYVKNSLAYSSVLPSAATNTLKAGLEANPGNELISKYLARNYYRTGFYELAINEYSTLLQKGPLSPVDERNYAASLYFSDKFEEALKALSDILAKEPDHPVMNRLMMYTQNELGNYEEAIAAGEHFFELRSDDEEFTPLLTDFTKLAEAYMAVEAFDQAIEMYRGAVKVNPEETAIYKEVATTLARANRTIEAIEFYQGYIDATQSTESADYMQLGIYNYQVAGQLARKVNAAKKAIEAEETVEVNLGLLNDSLAQFAGNAVEAFGKVIELAPESYQGYYRRANANTLLDLDLSKGLANSDYQKMIEILVADSEDNNQDRLVEAYRYFAIYYLYQYDASNSNDDKNQSIEYAKKVLELNPEDATATQIVEGLQQ